MSQRSVIDDTPRNEMSRETTFYHVCTALDTNNIVFLPDKFRPLQYDSSGVIETRAKRAERIIEHYGFDMPVKPQNLSNLSNEQWMNHLFPDPYSDALPSHVPVLQRQNAVMGLLREPTVLPVLPPIPSHPQRPAR